MLSISGFNKRQSFATGFIFARKNETGIVFTVVSGPGKFVRLLVKERDSS